MSNSAGLRARHGRTLGGLLLSGLSGCDGNFIVRAFHDVIVALFFVVGFIGFAVVAAEFLGVMRALARRIRRAAVAPKKRHTISVDFDGVIHRYAQPWVAAHVIPDPPVDGAIEWLHRTLQRFDVQILSTRALTWRGRRAMRAWLRQHAGNLYFDSPNGDRGLEEVRITAKKKPALVYIDDRAYRFDGANWPSIEDLWRLKPWGKR